MNLFIEKFILTLFSLLILLFPNLNSQPCPEYSAGDTVKNPLCVKTMMIQNQTDTFPVSLYNYINITELYIDNCEFDSIPNGIIKLMNLRTIYIDNSWIENISDEIKELKKLKQIVFSNYTYNEIPDAICDIQNLKKLSFINFESDNLPNCICDLKDLKKLFISTKEKANYTIRKQVFDFKSCIPDCEIKLVT